MAMEYFCCYHSYRKTLQRLSDSEVGRLFMALLEYSETDVAPELNGREQVAFDFIAADIDRAKEKYADRCRKNRENGTRAIGSVRHQSAPNGTEREQSPPKAKEKAKAKEKEKGQGNNPPTPQGPDLSAFSPEMQAAIQRWLQYKAERHEGYKPTGLKAFLSTVQGKLHQHSEAQVVELIDTCMSNGWRGVIWERLEQRPRQSGGGSGNPFLDMVREGGGL